MPTGNTAQHGCTTTTLPPHTSQHRPRARPIPMPCFTPRPNSSRGALSSAGADVAPCSGSRLYSLAPIVWNCATMLNDLLRTLSNVAHLIPALTVEQRVNQFPSVAQTRTVTDQDATAWRLPQAPLPRALSPNKTWKAWLDGTCKPLVCRRTPALDGGPIQLSRCKPH